MANRRKSTNVNQVNTSGVNSGNYGDWMLGGFTSYTPSEYADKRDSTNEKIENYSYKDAYLGGLNRGVPRLAQGVQRTSKWDTPTSQLAQQIQNISPFKFRYQDTLNQAINNSANIPGMTTKLSPLVNRMTANMLKSGNIKDPYQTTSNNLLKQIMSPEEFEFSKQADYDQIYDRIMNGQYNPEEDASYLAYKNAYTRGGQQAMHDSIAQAAALTGGFGSSYGQSVGQQNYQSYMADLANKIPELAQAAQDMYMNRLGVLNDLRDYETGMYQFGRNDLYNQNDALANASDRYYGRQQDRLANNWKKLGAVQDLDETYYNRGQDRYSNNVNLANTLSGIKNTDANIYNQDVNNTFDKFDAINGLRKTDYDLAQQDYDNYANTWSLVKGLSDSMYGRSQDDLANLYDLATLYGNLDTENYNRFLDEGDRFQNAAQWQWGIEHPSASGGSGGGSGRGRSSSGDEEDIYETVNYMVNNGASMPQISQTIRENPISGMAAQYLAKAAQQATIDRDGTRSQINEDLSKPKKKGKYVM